jgi:two-component system OmpR family response regulator
MTNVLLVDDDQLILQIYGKGLRQRGFEVQTASDGLEAMKCLRSRKPDLIVLDLMMPKFSGEEVLKFIRTQPGLKEVPVVFLSNSYFGDSDREAVAAGARKALLKVRCTPAILAATIHELLSEPAPPADLPAAPPVPNATLLPPRPEPPPTAPPPFPAAAARPAERPPPVAPVRASAPSGIFAPPQPVTPAAAPAQPPVRLSFFESIRTNCAALRDLSARLVEARSLPEKATRLQDLYRKMHFLNAAAGLAGAQKLLPLTSGLEALIFELAAQPARLTLSAQRTLDQAFGLASRLARHPQLAAEANLSPARVLVVTHDLTSTKGAAEALRRAGLQMDSCADAFAAIQLLSVIPCRLLIFEAALPETSGAGLCGRARTLTAHTSTPVIFLVDEANFTREMQELAPACDLIAKPVFPLELSVKVVTQLLEPEVREP